MCIPKDLQTFIEQASINLAKKKNFVPETEQDMKNFINDNFKEIVEDSRQLIWSIRDKDTRLLQEELGRKVWKHHRSSDDVAV